MEVLDAFQEVIDYWFLKATTLKAELERSRELLEKNTNFGRRVDRERDILQQENDALKAKLEKPDTRTAGELAESTGLQSEVDQHLVTIDELATENEELKADLKALEGGLQIRGWRENNTRLVAEIKELKAALIAALNQTVMPAAGKWDRDFVKVDFGGKKVLMKSVSGRVIVLQYSQIAKSWLDHRGAAVNIAGMTQWAKINIPEPADCPEPDDE